MSTKSAKVWYERNREEILKRRSSIRAASESRELDREYAKKYHEKNREKIHAQKAAWYEKNKEKKKLQQLVWRAANPDRERAIRDTRRSRNVSAPGKYTSAEVADLLLKQKGRCANPSCYKKCGKKYHIDHMIPLSKGGSNWITNIQILCGTCNVRKHAKDPFDWAREHGRLI